MQQWTGLEIVTGETYWVGLILNSMIVCGFMIEKKMEMDNTGRKLARWLKVAHQVGSDLCHSLLLPSGNVIARTTVQHVMGEDM